MTGKPHPAREAARNAGEKYYMSGKPCRKCGKTGRRYTSSANCVECAVVLQVTRYETKVGGILPKRAVRIARAAAPKDAKTIVTGIPCNNGHVGPRRIWNGSCIECEQERWKREKAAHRGPKVDARKARLQALASGDMTYEGQPCPRGHGTMKYTKTKHCVECTRLYNNRSSVKNRVRNIEYARQYRAKDGQAEKARKNTRAWYAENKWRHHAHTRARNMRKRNAIPHWANLKAIGAIYKEAARRSEIEGVSYHVDHVVPLKHRLVCGLHCETNLQILPAVDNLRKRNSWWPDMP